MGTFFDNLKITAKSGADEVKKTIKITQLESDISQLEKQEANIYAQIGKMAVENDGAEKYGDLGTKLLDLQKNRAAKNAELAELKPEEQNSGYASPSEDKDGFCQACGTKYTAGTKFCSSCGAKLP